MSKEVLLNNCNTNFAGSYVWSMYFYKIDRRSKERPYKFYKIRFKNDTYLVSYAQSLMSSVNKYQISIIEEVQEYDGENTKVSCDKIALDNELIATKWTSFVDALSCASAEKISGKVNGYVLFGVSKMDSNKTITFIKTANPITALTNKRSVVFTTTVEDELDMFADTVYRLYLNTDIMVLDGTMYTYNHNFEVLFDMEKTMAKAKTTAINKMVETNALAEKDSFKSYASQYTSIRTFITLKEERIERISKPENRQEIASMLEIELDESGRLVIDSKEKAAKIIKYFCFKIFRDGETNDVLEATSINTIKS